MACLNRSCAATKSTSAKEIRSAEAMVTISPPSARLVLRQSKLRFTNKMPNQTFAEAKPETPVQFSSLGSLGASTAPRLRKTSEAVTHKTLKASWNHGLSRNFFRDLIIPKGANGAARWDRNGLVQKLVPMFLAMD